MDYETLVANLLAGSKPRRQTVGSREFLIVPLSMLVPGVLNGSQGALYYSDEETKASAPLWDGMPITLYHPTGSDGTSLLSVRNRKGTLDPVIWDRQGIGYVRNSRFENGKLRAEGWFDVARTKQLDEHFSKTRYGYVPVLPRLESGEPVELSTGLFTANRRVKNGFDRKTNRPYIAEAHSYRPDHLAILPDVRGACSIEDGCGVHVANTFCPTGEGGGVDPTCSSKGEKHGKLQSFINRLFGKGAHSSYVSEAEHREREKNYRRLSLAYDSLAMNSLTHNHACCPSCKAGKPCEDKENERLGRDALRQKVEEGHNPPNWAVNEAKWKKAKARAKDEGHEEDWAYVVGIYKKMGGTIKGKPVKNSLLTWIENVWSDEARQASIEARRAKKSAKGFTGKIAALLDHIPTKTDLRLQHMNDKANAAGEKGDHEKASQMHGELADHYKRWHERQKKHGSHEEDLEHSKTLYEIHKKASEEHAEKARKKKATHNQETGMKLTANQRSGIVQFLCNSEPWKSKQGSQVFLSQLDDETLQSLGAQAKGVQEAQRLVGNKGKQTQVIDEDDDEDEEEEIASSGSVRNQFTEDELDEFSRQMFGQPASVVRQIVGNANKINQREKKQLIGRLVVNLQGDARERMAKRLMHKDAEELRDMLAMLQPTNNSFLDQPEDDLGLLARSFGVQDGGFGGGEGAALNFAGAGAGGGQTFKDDADNVLPWGTVSFNDLASPALRKTS